MHWELDRTFATFLPPEQDLLKKTRSGAKIAKIHDKPATPHRRAITDPAAGKMPASRMSAPFKKNRAMTISRQILALTGQLRTLAKAKGGTAHDRHSEVLS
ncbi:hypothetical protein [Paeniglutamicibacter kerguelensis]|uniref:hypothetical protein n=1 Tax=Paeniglutamicibacter kerguelensis TaxID=254788 RepID=UPI00315A3BDA